MKYPTDNYGRDSRRRKGWNYGSAGQYFVTICVADMQESFGEVRDGTMVFNNVGRIAHELWLEILRHHNTVDLDAFQIMPNHVHGIIVIKGNSASDVACNVAAKETTTQNVAPTKTVSCNADTMEYAARNVASRNLGNWMSTISPMAGTLGTIVRSYKSAVSKSCHTNGYFDFSWQSRYHDHIIRNDGELTRIREYIRKNPHRWEQDKNDPFGPRNWMD